MQLKNVMMTHFLKNLVEEKNSSHCCSDTICIDCLAVGKILIRLFFLAVFPLILTLQMYINYTQVNAAWDSAFWQWLVTITKSFTSLVSRLVGFFKRRLQTTSVKSHARKKPRVGYFLSLSIDQIKMHQRRN